MGLLLDTGVLIRAERRGKEGQDFSPLDFSPGFATAMQPSALSPHRSCWSACIGRLRRRVGFVARRRSRPCWPPCRSSTSR
jgi:hypothetical protein